MGLNFLVLEGTRKGDLFRAAPGLTVGRSRGDITLRDPKVSSLHARIEQARDGALFVVDAGSANGIWLNEKKVDRIELSPGTIFRIGETHLQVIDDYALELTEDERETWQGKLWSYFKSVATRPGWPPPTPVEPFPTVVELRFIQGPQIGTRWLLGYGPRPIGSGTPDLHIDDPDLPEICFALVTIPEGVRFQTDHTTLVLLNDRAVKAETLQDGDVIRVGAHALRIGLL